MFDQVIDRYAGTGGAYCALSQKAELLWHLGKREEMCKTYAQLREVLRGYTGTEKVRLAYRTMDCRVGQHRAEQLYREINRDPATRLMTPQERWDRLAELCARWQHNADGVDRATADLYIVFVNSSRGRDAEVLA